MAIRINLDVEMAKQKKGLTELAGEVDITLANLSILKNNKAKAVRLSTLNAICKALHCQPGDLMETGSSRRIPQKHQSLFFFYGNRKPDLCFLLYLFSI